MTSPAPSKPLSATAQMRRLLKDVKPGDGVALTFPGDLEAQRKSREIAKWTAQGLWGRGNYVTKRVDQKIWIIRKKVAQAPAPGGPKLSGGAAGRSGG